LKVKVAYFAIVREITNQREETVDVKNSTTVLDLLRLIAEKHGNKMKEYIFDPKTDNPRPYLKFLLNEKAISSLNDFSTTLTSDSTLAIIPPVGGG
jgi:MoaD family protein